MEEETDYTIEENTIKYSYQKDGQREKWYEKYAKFVEFLRENGRTPAMDRDEAGLGIWLKVQKKLYREGSLSPDMMDRLNDINFSDYVSKRKSNIPWHVYYQKIKEFSLINGRLPISNINEAGLGKWIISQKRLYSEGRLTKYKIDKLEDIPYWEWRKKKQTPDWQDYYDKLRDFVERKGRLPFKRDGQKDLLRWMGSQRRAYRLNRVSEESIAKLESINGWSWVGNLTPNQWERDYGKIIDFVTTKGRLPSYEKDGSKLLRWIKLQKKFYKDGCLSGDRIEKLEKIDIWDWGTESTKKRKNTSLTESPNKKIKIKEEDH